MPSSVVHGLEGQGPLIMGTDCKIESNLTSDHGKFADGTIEGTSTTGAKGIPDAISNCKQHNPFPPLSKGADPYSGESPGMRG
jgi:hypothetical protein